MIKFNKGFNLKLFSLLIAVVFLLTNTVYAINPSGKSHLRLPATGRYDPERLGAALTAMLNMEGLDERQHGLLNRALATFFVGFNEVREDIDVLGKDELARIDPYGVLAELAEVEDLRVYRFTREQLIKALREIGAHEKDIERDIAYITANLISHPGRFRDGGELRATNLFILDECYTALTQLTTELQAQWARHERADLENLALLVEQQRTEKQIQEDFPLEKVTEALQRVLLKAKEQRLAREAQERAQQAREKLTQALALLTSEEIRIVIDTCEAVQRGATQRELYRVFQVIPTFSELYTLVEDAGMGIEGQGNAILQLALTNRLEKEEAEAGRLFRERLARADQAEEQLTQALAPLTSEEIETVTDAYQATQREATQHEAYEALRKEYEALPTFSELYTLVEDAGMGIEGQGRAILNLALTNRLEEEAALKEELIAQVTSAPSGTLELKGIEHDYPIEGEFVANLIRRGWVVQGPAEEGRFSFELGEKIKTVAAYEAGFVIGKAARFVEEVNGLPDDREIYIIVRPEEEADVETVRAALEDILDREVIGNLRRERRIYIATLRTEDAIDQWTGLIGERNSIDFGDVPAPIPMLTENMAVLRALATAK